MLDNIAMFESPQQWLIVLIIVLLLFGGSRIPELMRGLGSGMREFKKGLNEDDKADERPAASKSSGDKE
ncbi:MAG: twin-arginine translocase TatA/TatE family subunit [Chthonomonadales bacterium]|nr:twin-arginine translocase TatA/TatE family subunit [Chthonomonadales bacterium]